MTHTHDGIDWVTRLAAMRRADEDDVFILRASTVYAGRKADL